MSKLSEPLKALIKASYARPNTIAAPRQIKSTYEKIAHEAQSKQIGLPAWLSASTAATMTMNSPDSLLELYHVATSSTHSTSETHSIYAAELMREVGLKCIGFNGVPRTINCLGAFYGSLPQDVRAALDKREPRRALTRQNVKAVLDRGHWLWNSIYHPFTDKLTAKLAQSHPDLPIHIIESEYGCLFSDPPMANDPAKVGRILTSVIAVACLRSQSGVGPQVVSHVFGLRKSFEDGSAEAAGEESIIGGKWLATDEGSIWLLEITDRIVEAIGGQRGTSFAPGFEKPPRAKL